MNQSRNTPPRSSDRQCCAHRLRQPRHVAKFAAVVICGLLFGHGWAEPAQAEYYPPFKTMCDKRDTVTKGGHSLKLPYCANKSLTSRNTSVVRGIIAVHGVTRDGQLYYKSINSAGQIANDAHSSSVVIAPQFLEESDIRRFSLPNDMLFWEPGNWRKGDLSISTSAHPRPFSVSSYELVDRFVHRLADASVFPNLREIVIVGHSMGGQFLNRYAAGGKAPASVAKDRSDIEFRFIVGNPVSYLYMSPERPVIGSTNSFYVPSGASCRYNNYLYGLDNLNSYMSDVGAATIKQRYASRTVLMLIGEDDDFPSGGCASNYQGRHRRERAEYFYKYLKRHYGNGIVDRHRLRIVSGIGHDSWQLFRSDCGLSYIFGYDPNGSCPRPNVGSSQRQDQAIAAELTSRVIDEDWDTVNFGSGAFSSSPLVFASIQSFYGSDPVGLRIRNVTGSRFQLMAQEEESDDSEIGHANEVAGYVAMESGLVTDDRGEVIGEAGSLSRSQRDDNQWRTITLTRTYDDPVVMANMTTFNGVDPAHIRIRNVTRNSFQWQIEEWDYQDGNKTAETIDYAVFESGIHDLPGGRVMEAGIVRADDAWETVHFSAGFPSTPVVLSQSQTDNGSDAIVTRQRDADSRGLEVRLQEEQGGDGNHAMEDVGYVAIER